MRKGLLKLPFNESLASLNVAEFLLVSVVVGVSQFEVHRMGYGLMAVQGHWMFVWFDIHC